VVELRGDGKEGKPGKRPAAGQPDEGREVEAGNDPVRGRPWEEPERKEDDQRDRAVVERTEAPGDLVRIALRGAPVGVGIVARITAPNVQADEEEHADDRQAVTERSPPSRRVEKPQPSEAAPEVAAYSSHLAVIMSPMSRVI